MGKVFGRKMGMPLDKFTDEAYRGLVSGIDQVIIGSIGPAEAWNDMVTKRRAAFENLSKMVHER